EPWGVVAAPQRVQREVAPSRQWFQHSAEMLVSCEFPQPAVEAHVEVDVCGDDRTGLALRVHPVEHALVVVDDLAQIVEAGRVQVVGSQSRGSPLEHLPDDVQFPQVVDVHPTHLRTTMRYMGGETVVDQPLHGLPDRTAADVELSGQLGDTQCGTRRQPVTEYGSTDSLIGAISQQSAGREW